MTALEWFIGTNYPVFFRSEITQSAAVTGRHYSVSHRSLICTSTGQEFQQKPEEGWQNFTQRARSVWDHDLPDVQGGLAHHQLRVGAAHVQACQHPVPPLHTQSTNNSLQRNSTQLYYPLLKLTIRTRHAITQFAFPSGFPCWFLQN